MFSTVIFSQLISMRVHTTIIHYIHLCWTSLDNATRDFTPHGDFINSLYSVMVKSTVCFFPPIHHSDSPCRMVKCEFPPLITVKSTTQFSPGVPRSTLCLFCDAIPCTSSGAAFGDDVPIEPLSILQNTFARRVSGSAV